MMRLTGRKFADRLNRGFSLIEMMVVLLIMAIVLGVALPNFVDHQKRNKVETAAENIAARFRLARQKAIARRTKYKLTLNDTNGTYLLERRLNGGTWVADPPDPFQIPDGIDLQFDFGEREGSGSPEVRENGKDEIHASTTAKFITRIHCCRTPRCCSHHGHGRHGTL